MGIQPDSSPFGSQTVTGPGWPNVNEEQLEEAAAHYTKLATNITGHVVPQQTSQLMNLTGQWTGAGSVAAAGEATTIIGGHEANGAQAAAIAAKLQSMVAAVIKTKNLVNATAEEVQAECMALSAAPFPNVQELIQSRIKMGLSQNIAAVTASATEVANFVGAPPSIPTAGMPPQVAQTAQKDCGVGRQGRRSDGPDDGPDDADGRPAPADARAVAAAGNATAATTFAAAAAVDISVLRRRPG